MDLGDNFRSDRYDFEYVALQVRPRSDRRPYHYTPIPFQVVRVAMRFGQDERLQQLLEAIYLATMRPGDVAYLWPGASLALYRKLHARGVPIVREMINSEEQFRRRELRAAYSKHGLVFDESGLDPKDLEQRATFELADRVFCPSGWVATSLREAGLPEAKLASTSYAWEPRSFAPPARGPDAEDRVPVFLCVAFASVRKGTLELLEAWARKTVRAKLLLVGPVDAEISTRVDELARRDDVERRDFVADLAPLYGAADAYIMLSHEEGSPIVSYFALAAGLPIIGTPPVTSGIIESGVHGFVHAADDLDGVAASIDRLVNDPELRRRMGAAARERSAHFTWQRVAERRVAVFESL